MCSRAFRVEKPASGFWKQTTQTVRSYLQSDLRDQQPEIRAPVQFSRVISASHDNLRPSSLPVAVATDQNNKRSSGATLTTMSNGSYRCVSAPFILTSVPVEPETVKIWPPLVSTCLSSCVLLSLRPPPPVFVTDTKRITVTLEAKSCLAGINRGTCEQKQDGTVVFCWSFLLIKSHDPQKHQTLKQISLKQDISGK